MDWVSEHLTAIVGCVAFYAVAVAIVVRRRRVVGRVQRGTCPACGFENGPTAEVCRDCGAGFHAAISRNTRRGGAILGVMAILTLGAAFRIDQRADRFVFSRLAVRTLISLLPDRRPARTWLQDRVCEELVGRSNARMLSPSENAMWVRRQFDPGEVVRKVAFVQGDAEGERRLVIGRTEIDQWFYSQYVLRCFVREADRDLCEVPLHQASRGCFAWGSQAFAEREEALREPVVVGSNTEFSLVFVDETGYEVLRARLNMPD